MCWFPKSQEQSTYLNPEIPKPELFLRELSYGFGISGKDLSKIRLVSHVLSFIK